MSDKPEPVINTANMKHDLELASKRQSQRNISSAEIEQEPISTPSKQESQNINVLRNKKQDSAITTQTKPIRGFNVPECILIVFDRVKDEMETDFFECGDIKVAPRKVMHRLLRMFIHNKLAISEKHVFAIMALNEGDCSLKVPKFTKNIGQLDKMLQNMSEGCDTEDVFNMTHVFETILEKHGYLIHYDKSPPDMIYRVIFCYGRSYTLPILNLTSKIRDLLEAPNFFFDVVYTHEAPPIPSKHEEIFKYLHAYDRRAVGYIFSIERNLKAGHLAMALLLGHPFQRKPLKSSSPYLHLNGEVQVPISNDDEKEDVD